MASQSISIADAACLAVLVAVGSALGAPAMARGRGAARGTTDQFQVRQLYQGLASHAETNQGKYPAPSQIDLNNTTMARANRPLEKNTTGDLMSFLVFNGYVTLEMLVSPAEVNLLITVDTDYEFDRPSRAADPDRALWDPGFAGTPHDTAPERRPSRTDVREGHQSYSHMVLIGKRLKYVWTTYWGEREPLVGNRGPLYTGTTYPTSGRWRLATGAGGTDSNTLRIHGDPSRWDGYTALNDGTVYYFGLPNPGITIFRYRRTSGSPLYVSDNMFVNETDEGGGDSGTNVSNGRNAFLRSTASITQVGGNTSLTYWQD
jgi:hypothetical protein